MRRPPRLSVVEVAAALGLLASLLVLFAGCTVEDADPSWPDAPVILISLDTVRADHLSVYGYDRPTTPGLESFAEEAVVFERFYHSGGGTLPSHTSMLTGLTPVAHAVRPSHEAGNVLHSAWDTLAEQLRDAGYWTAAFTDRGWLRSKFGIDQGFQVFDDEGGRLVKILPKVERWLHQYHGEPFFLFLHTYDAHSQGKRLPYDCPAPWPETFTGGMSVDFDGCRGDLCASRYLLDLDRRLADGSLAPEDAFTPEELAYVVALYDGCIRYLDHQMTEFFAHLEELGVYDDSLIVVTSDHGEEFLDHGRLVHQQGGYDELTRIPLLIKFPGGRFGGRRVTQLAAMVDVMPTILDAVARETPRTVQGKSLMQILKPLQGDEEPVAVRDAVHIYNVIRTDRWKLFNRTQELYDLEADPEETVNLWDDHPDVVAELAARLDERLRRDRKVRDDFTRAVKALEGDVELTSEEIEELRALGYLD